MEGFVRNGIEQWGVAILAAIAVLIALVLLKRQALQHLLASKPEPERDIRINVLQTTHAWFLAVFALYVSANIFLTTPETLQAIRTFAIIVLMIQLGMWANHLIAYAIHHYQTHPLKEGPLSKSLVNALGFITKVVLWTFILLFLLANLNFDIGALIAGLGIGGIAVALAAQNILRDLFASLSIMIDRPFVIGDFIVVDKYMGKVEHIGLKSTRIRSLGGELLIFSNTDLLKSRVSNHKRMQERRVVFTLSIPYPEEGKIGKEIPKAIQKILEPITDVRFQHAHLTTCGQSSLDFEVVYDVLKPCFTHYRNVQQEINYALLKHFEGQKIAIS